MTRPSREEVRGLAALFAAAVIWGFAFVAQREGMRHIGPFAFNGFRFALGSIILLPWLVSRRSRRQEPSTKTPATWRIRTGIVTAGVVLFLAASLQQIGLVSTTAGKAGFITGLYVVIVPTLGAITSQRIPKTAWAGCLLAAAGLYLLTMTGRFSISVGDAFVLISAFGWALHVQLVGWLIRHRPPTQLAVTQFAICALLSLLVAGVREPVSLHNLKAALWPLLYAGVVSVGLAYTLQLVGQQTVRPTQAGVIMSLEAAFAVLGGWLWLGEALSARGALGCCLMLAGMTLAQLRLRDQGRARSPAPIP